MTELFLFILWKWNLGGARKKETNLFCTADKVSCVKYSPRGIKGGSDKRFVQSERHDKESDSQRKYSEGNKQDLKQHKTLKWLKKKSEIYTRNSYLKLNTLF